MQYTQNPHENTRIHIGAFSDKLKSRATPQELKVLRWLEEGDYLFKFQYPVASKYLGRFYYPDFTLFTQNGRAIVLEIDGKIHENSKKYDFQRDSWLRNKGYIVVRLKNELVDNDWSRVVRRLRGFKLRKDYVFEPRSVLRKSLSHKKQTLKA
jgi:very-short-patch-repair endonuclease